jgi:hypothetical protein
LKTEWWGVPGERGEEVCDRGDDDDDDDDK